MTTKFVTNHKGKKTAAIIPINEYEDLLHLRHLNFELSGKYTAMIDKMFEEKAIGVAEYVSYKNIKDKFQRS